MCLFFATTVASYEVLRAVGGFFCTNSDFPLPVAQTGHEVDVAHLSVSTYMHRSVSSTSPTLHATHATLEINQGGTRGKEDKEDVISYLSLLVSLWLSLGFLPASRALDAFGESWWYL